VLAQFGPLLPHAAIQGLESRIHGLEFRVGGLDKPECDLVVTSEVLPQDTSHDDADNSGEEDDNDERVDDGEPVDLVVLDLIHLQVHVPPERFGFRG
jgi:hypothetical protein